MSYESSEQAEQLELFRERKSFVERISLQRSFIQHNDLTTARYSLTAIEQNIMLLLLSQINENDEDNKSYLINGEDIFYNQTKKSASANFKLLKESTEKLMKRIVKIKSSKGNELITHFVSSCEYIDRKGTVEVSYDPKLKPFLVGIKNNYTTISLNNVLSFKGKYTKRLYQLLCKFNDTGILILNIDELVEMLQLNNEGEVRKRSNNEKVEEKKKKRWWELYGSIKQRVLDPAIEEINDKESKSDFYIYKMNEKQGARKKIVQVTILFRKKETGIAIESNPSFEQLISRLKRFGLNDKQCRKIVDNIDEVEINKTCYEIQLRANGDGQNKAITSIAAYTWKTFERKMNL